MTIYFARKSKSGYLYMGIYGQMEENMAFEHEPEITSKTPFFPKDLTNVIASESEAISFDFIN